MPGLTKASLFPSEDLQKTHFHFAVHKNIGLVELREIVEVDRKGGNAIPDIAIGTINIKSKIRRPEILTIGFVTIDPNFTPKRINSYQYKVPQ
jgi:hypothetical protein